MELAANPGQLKGKGSPTTPGGSGPEEKQQTQVTKANQNSQLPASSGYDWLGCPVDRYLADGSGRQKKHCTADRRETVSCPTRGAIPFVHRSEQQSQLMLAQRQANPIVGESQQFSIPTVHHRYDRQFSTID